MKLLMNLLAGVALLFSLSCNDEANAEQINDTTVQSPADEIPDAAPTAALSDVKADAGTSSAQVSRPSDGEPSANKENKSLSSTKDSKTTTTPSIETKEKPVELKKSEAKSSATKDNQEDTSSKSATQKRTRGTPKAAFQEMVHDFGVIGQGEKVEHKFVFENVGDADLEILNVDVTCGCTIPSFPFIPIAPGEKGTIGVTYNSTGKLGNQKPMITVITNAKPRTYKLYFKGVVDADRAKTTSTGSEEN